MTEAEYIATRDLQRLESAQGILDGICADNSTIIDRAALAGIKRQLYSWIELHYGRSKPKVCPHCARTRKPQELTVQVSRLTGQMHGPEQE